MISKSQLFPMYVKVCVCIHTCVCLCVCARDLGDAVMLEAQELHPGVLRKNPEFCFSQALAI